MEINKLDLSKITDKKILVFGVHGDDWVEISGTLRQLVRDNEVIGVVSSDGRMGTRDFELKGDDLVKKRMEETRKYVDKLGIKKCLFWMYPDWDLVNRKNHLIKKIVKLMLKEKVDIVLSGDPWGQYEGYLEPDVRELAWAVVESIRLATNPRWVQLHRLGRRMLQPEPQIWLMNCAQANVVVDVSEQWSERVELMDVFESQLYYFPQKDDALDLITDVAVNVGEKVNVQYGEEFRILDY